MGRPSAGAWAVDAGAFERAVWAQEGDEGGLSGRLHGSVGAACDAGRLRELAGARRAYAAAVGERKRLAHRFARQRRRNALRAERRSGVERRLGGLAEGEEGEREALLEELALLEEEEEEEDEEEAEEEEGLDRLSAETLRERAEELRADGEPPAGLGQLPPALRRLYYVCEAILRHEDLPKAPLLGASVDPEAHAPYFEAVLSPRTFQDVRRDLVRGRYGEDALSCFEDMRAAMANCRVAERPAGSGESERLYRVCERLVVDWAVRPAARGELEGGGGGDPGPPLEDSVCDGCGKGWETGDAMIYCDSCDAKWHLGCLEDLSEAPEDEWFCGGCLGRRTTLPLVRDCLEGATLSLPAGDFPFRGCALEGGTMWLRLDGAPPAEARHVLGARLRTGERLSRGSCAALLLPVRGYASWAPAFGGGWASLPLEVDPRVSRSAAEASAGDPEYLAGLRALAALAQSDPLDAGDWLCLLPTLLALALQSRPVARRLAALEERAQALALECTRRTGLAEDGFVRPLPERLGGALREGEAVPNDVGWDEVSMLVEGSQAKGNQGPLRGPGGRFLSKAEAAAARAAARTMDLGLDPAAPLPEPKEEHARDPWEPALRVLEAAAARSAARDGGYAMACGCERKAKRGAKKKGAEEEGARGMGVGVGWGWG